MYHQAYPAARHPIWALGRLFGLCAIALAGGCGYEHGGSIPYSAANFGTRGSLRGVPLLSDYRIAPLDTLAIKVFEISDLSGDFEVDLGGKISMPVIGAINAADHMTARRDEHLTQKLRAKYLENSVISAEIRSSSGRSVTVDVLVNKDDGFSANAPLILMQAVAQLGSASPEANIRPVVIFRTLGGQRKVAAFDLANICRGEMDDPPVSEGEIAELLATSRFRSILAEATGHFYFDIVDGPTALGLADAPARAVMCNGVLWVVEARRARPPAVVAGISRLGELGAHVVGALLTNATERSGSSVMAMRLTALV